MSLPSNATRGRSLIWNAFRQLHGRRHFAAELEIEGGLNFPVYAPSSAVFSNSVSSLIELAWSRHPSLPSPMRTRLNARSLANPDALNDRGLSSACISADRFSSRNVWMLWTGGRHTRPAVLDPHIAQGGLPLIRPVAAARLPSAARLRNRTSSCSCRFRDSPARSSPPARTRSRHLEQQGQRATAARSSFHRGKGCIPEPIRGNVEAPARASRRGKMLTPIFPVTSSGGQGLEASSRSWPDTPPGGSGSGTISSAQQEHQNTAGDEKDPSHRFLCFPPVKQCRGYPRHKTLPFSGAPPTMEEMRK